MISTSYRNDLTFFGLGLLRIHSNKDFKKKGDTIDNEHVRYQHVMYLNIRLSLFAADPLSKSFNHEIYDLKAHEHQWQGGHVYFVAPLRKRALREHQILLYIPRMTGDTHHQLRMDDAYYPATAKKGWITATITERREADLFYIELRVTKDNFLKYTRGLSQNL